MKNPIYKLVKVKVKIAGNQVLDLRKVEIHRGSCYVIYGDIGSGKTTLLNLLSRKGMDIEGEVHYDGNDIKAVASSTLKGEIYHLSQSTKDPWFNPSVESYINKAISTHKHISEPAKRFKDVVRNLKLKSLLDRNYKNLSDGEKRWIELAAAIACDTKVLIIDGFGQYLSEDKIKLLSRILYRKVNYDGSTLIIGTHVKEKLNRIASVYIKLDRGKIVSVRSKSKSNSRSKPKRYNKK